MPFTLRTGAGPLASLAFILVTATATPLSAQSVPGVSQGPKLGEMEVKAYQKIPRSKVAVQLTSDTHLSRELRRRGRSIEPGSLVLGVPGRVARPTTDAQREGARRTAAHYVELIRVHRDDRG